MSCVAQMEAAEIIILGPAARQLMFGHLLAKLTSKKAAANNWNDLNNNISSSIQQILMHMKMIRQNNEPSMNLNKRSNSIQEVWAGSLTTI